jgi:hypothetical protein
MGVNTSRSLTAFLLKTNLCESALLTELPANRSGDGARGVLERWWFRTPQKRMYWIVFPILVFIGFGKLWPEHPLPLVLLVIGLFLPERLRRVRLTLWILFCLYTAVYVIEWEHWFVHG